MKSKNGFTLVELMIVVSIVALLATLALPSFSDRTVRAQVVEAATFSDFVKQAVQGYYATRHEMPPNNAAAGLPPSDKIVSTLVSQVSVTDGAVVITFGNRVNPQLIGKKLTLRPAIVEDAPVVPISWICAGARSPDKMKLLGVDHTDVPARLLPLNCR